MDRGQLAEAKAAAEAPDGLESAQEAWIHVWETDPESAEKARARLLGAWKKNDRGRRVREAAERELLETLSEDAIEPLAVVVERATEAGIATEVLPPALGQVQRRVARRAAEGVLIASS